MFTVLKIHKQLKKKKKSDFTILHTSILLIYLYKYLSSTLVFWTLGRCQATLHPLHSH